MSTGNCAVVRSSSFINLCYIYKCTLQQNFPDLRKFNIFSNRCSIQNYPPTFFTSLIFCLYFYMTMKLIWNRFTVLPSKPLLTAINSLPNSKVLHLSKFKAVSGQSPPPRTIAPPPLPRPHNFLPPREGLGQVWVSWIRVRLGSVSGSRGGGAGNNCRGGGGGQLSMGGIVLDYIQSLCRRLNRCNRRIERSFGANRKRRKCW